MNRKLKIGFVFDDTLDNPDGVQQYVLILGRWLAKQGHDVHYLVGETKRTDIPHMHSMSRNVHVKFNQNRMSMPLPAQMEPIRTLLAKEQFDILHVQVPYSPAFAARVIKAAGVHTAVIGTFHVAPHSRLVSLGNKALGIWVRSTLKRFDVMLATSEPAQAFAKETFGIESTVVDLPIPLDAFFGKPPLQPYQGTRNVVFLGRLVERKGCQHLLKAVDYAVSHNIWPAATNVIICGGGPLDAQLKEYVARHGLSDIVTFVGYISEEDKPNYLAAGDVVVYPSTGGESFGVVLLEAMAASRGMILAGNNPGYASVMHERPESLFDPLDTPSLAHKIVDALTDTKARTAAREWQQTYVKRFDVNEIGKQTVAIYEQALHKRAD